MTTRPLTARLATATLAVLVGIGLPALTALMMVRAPATDALPTATLERVEVVARRIEPTAQTDPAAPLSQTVQVFDTLIAGIFNDRSRADSATRTATRRAIAR
jgi:hypothetical protein